MSADYRHHSLPDTQPHRMYDCHLCPLRYELSCALVLHKAIHHQPQQMSTLLHELAATESMELSDDQYFYSFVITTQVKSIPRIDDTESVEAIPEIVTIKMEPFPELIQEPDSDEPDALSLSTDALGPCDYAKPVDQVRKVPVGEANRKTCPICAHSMHYNSLRRHMRSQHRLSDPKITVIVEEATAALSGIGTKKSKKLHPDDTAAPMKNPPILPRIKATKKTRYFQTGMYRTMCPVCDERMHSSRIRKHLESKHSLYGADNEAVRAAHPDKCKIIQQRSHFVCTKCPATFVTGMLLRVHDQSVHRRRPDEKVRKLIESDDTLSTMTCNACAHNSTSRLSALDHLRNEHADTLLRIDNSLDECYGCEVCGKSFKPFLSLSQHQRIRHDRDTSCLCPVCGIRKSDAKSLAVHLAVHRGERPFVCDLCDKKFTVKGTLVDHMRTHSGVKPFVCPVDGCGMQFAQCSGLNQHRRMKHETLVPKSCEVCGKTFRLKSHLRIHMMVHTGQLPYKCKLCPLAFRMKKSLDVHITRHRGERPFLCSTCGKGFLNRSGLRSHSKSKRGCHAPL